MKQKAYIITEQGKLQKVNTPKATVWSREKINHLIELYKKHECLWNHWHEAYKSKDKRKRAIEEICKTLNIENFEFGKKIHNLRNQFNTEMKKLEQRIEESGVNIDDKNDTEYRCKWSHFESLMFLRNVIEPRPGGYQSSFQTPKKMRIKFNQSSSEDEIHVSSNLPSDNNTSTAEDLSQYPCDDNINEEVITDDYQTFENEILEIDQTNTSGDVCDQKYQPSAISAHNFVKSTNKITQHTSQTPTSCSSSLEDINANDEPCTDFNSNKATGIQSQKHIVTTHLSPTLAATSPLISSIPPSSSSNRPASISRDQWDAFGELVANEFRNLNSDISRKRLKRKIMHAMLEVGEEDDQLISNRSRNN